MPNEFESVMDSLLGHSSGGMSTWTTFLSFSSRPDLQGNAAGEKFDMF